MKQILTAIANWILFLTLPIWCGPALYFFIAKDYFDEEKPYLRMKWDQGFKGQRRFWEEIT